MAAPRRSNPNAGLRPTEICRTLSGKDRACSGIVDVDPVLRLFGNKRETARKDFAEWVGAAYDEDESAYMWAENDILGSEEFVDAHIHRLGDVELECGRIERKNEQRPFDGESLIAAVEAVLGMSRNDLYGSGKNAQAVMAKEVLILTGRQIGASFPQLANLTGLDPSTVSRRYEAAKRKTGTDTKLAYAKDLVAKKYRENIGFE